MINDKCQNPNVKLMTNDQLKNLDLRFNLNFVIRILSLSKRSVFFKRGQSVLEYATLLAIVGVAFITMSFYVKRAVQGKLNKVSDYVMDKDVVPSTSSGGASGGGPPI